MALPQILAFPPTSIRAVSAGAVVGNPVGSSGTRAKALTSAELKAIVEASGPAFLPLSGGTLTGPITGTGGLIEQRNGLTAQCLDIFETFTSSTNNGKLRFKATASGHQIGSARGSAGGSNRTVQLGHFDAADVFSNWLQIATTGAVESAGALTIRTATTPALTVINPTANNALIRLTRNNGAYSWDVGQRQGQTSQFQIYDVTAGLPRLSIDTSGVFTFGGAITPATLADAAAPNGSIYYSSTASKLVYKDAGGTVNVLY